MAIFSPWRAIAESPGTVRDGVGAVICGPPRLRPHWPIRPLRCPQKRGPSALRGGVASRNAAACKASSRLGAALRRSSVMHLALEESELAKRRKPEHGEQHDRQRGRIRRVPEAEPDLVDVVEQ